MKTFESVPAPSFEEVKTSIVYSTSSLPSPAETSPSQYAATTIEGHNYTGP